MGQIRRPEASVTILPRAPSPLEDLLSRASSNTSLPPQQSPPLLALENGPNESSGNKPCVDVAQQASMKPQGNDVTVAQKTDVQPDVDLDVRPDVKPAAQAAPSQPVACQ